MPKADPKAARVLRVADLSPRRDRPFEIHLTPEESIALQDRLGLLGLRKLRFSGQISAMSGRGWRLTADLGATAIQPCVVTLDPVTTRIDTDVERKFVPSQDLPDITSETEMPEDDTLEELPDQIDLLTILAESLALALPDYPRAPSAALEQTAFAAEGITPMTDEDTKPFAGLQALRDELEKKDL